MAKLHSQKLLDVSKAKDKMIVAYLQSLGKRCKVADDLADKRGKYDIVVWSEKLGTMRIDTKYTLRPETRLFYEIDKHKNSDANFIWYFLEDRDYISYLVRKDALKKLTACKHKYQAREGGDWLVDFDVNELKQETEYWQIYMSKLLAD